MIIFGIIMCTILFFVGVIWEDSSCDSKGFVLSAFSFILGIGLFIFGAFHGFLNYPATEGSHQGTLTAVDMEGYFFRRYKVYLKSSAFTEQGDETEYCVYLEETELSNKLKEAIGKKVKLNYSHKGGYIPYNSCGTYHIDSFEIIENSDENK